MAYLTFAEYKSYDGTLDETAFLRHEFMARAVIDRHTFWRLKNDNEVSEAVKRLTYELIRLYEKADAPQVQSESNDGYSISYAAGAVLTPDAVESKARELIGTYLEGEKNAAGVSLLSRWA